MGKSKRDFIDPAALESLSCPCLVPQSCHIPLFYGGKEKMAKTNMTVKVFYDGNQEVKDVIVDLLAKRIKRNVKVDMAKTKKGAYNQIMSYDDGLSGLAG